MKRRLVEAEHKAREAAARAAEELRAMHAELQVCGDGLWTAGWQRLLAGVVRLMSKLPALPAGGRCNF